MDDTEHLGSWRMQAAAMVELPECSCRRSSLVADGDMLSAKHEAIPLGTKSGHRAASRVFVSERALRALVP